MISRRCGRCVTAFQGGKVLESLRWNEVGQATVNDGDVIQGDGWSRW